MFTSNPPEILADYVKFFVFDGFVTLSFWTVANGKWIKWIKTAKQPQAISQKKKYETKVTSYRKILITLCISLVKSQMMHRHVVKKRNQEIPEEVKSLNF